MSPEPPVSTQLHKRPTWNILDVLFDEVGIRSWLDHIIDRECTTFFDPLPTNLFISTR